MSQLRIPSESYTPRMGTSPFTAGTHFAQQSGEAQASRAVPATTLTTRFGKKTLSSPRFGNASVIKQLSPLMQQTYKVFGPIWRNRGIELLFIDLIAFAGIRSTMDFCREYLFKNTIHNKKQFNWPAARERLMLEVIGSMPDGIGLLAFMYGTFAEKVPFWKGKKAYSNQFTNIDTLNYFRSVLKKSSVLKSEDFLKQIATHIDPQKAEQIFPLLKEAVKYNQVETVAAKIAKMFNQTHLDRDIQGNTFALNTLIDDARHLVCAATKSTGDKLIFGGWRKQAEKLLRNTAKINNFRIPAGVALGLLLNGTSPYLIQAVTRHFEGIDDYVGEQGLRELNVVNTDNITQKPRKRGFLPYLRETLSNGNPIPSLVSLIPLPIVLGWVDPEKLASQGVKASWNGFKPGWQKFLNMMQFGKAWPFVGGGQTAMLYAFCVFSRIAAARNAVEFRERTVDAFLGWSIFILATPKLKQWASLWFDKHYGTQLLKNVGGQLERKTESEILKLVKNPKTMQKTLGAFVKINVGAILGTIALLGVAEPYLSIKITEWQSQWMNARRKQYHERAQRYGFMMS